MYPQQQRPQISRRNKGHFFSTPGHTGPLDWVLWWPPDRASICNLSLLKQHSHTTHLGRPRQWLFTWLSFSLKHHRNKLEGNYSPARSPSYLLSGKYSIRLLGLGTHSVAIRLHQNLKNSFLLFFFLNQTSNEKTSHQPGEILAFVSRIYKCSL